MYYLVSQTLREPNLTTPFAEGRMGRFLKKSLYTLLMTERIYVLSKLYGLPVMTSTELPGFCPRYLFTTYSGANMSVVGDQHLPRIYINSPLLTLMFLPQSAPMSPHPRLYIEWSSDECAGSRPYHIAGHELPSPHSHQTKIICANGYTTILRILNPLEEITIKMSEINFSWRV